MGISVGDIKKAILGGGDVAPLMPALRQALKDPPLPSVSSLEVPVELPEATALLGYIDNDLATLLQAWLEGRGYDGASVPEAADLTIVGLAPYGRNISTALESIIAEVKPDILAIDTSPIGLSANMLYAFSTPCAIGLPVYGEILDKDEGQLYAVETFYPGNTSQTAIVKGWLTKVPLIPVGMPPVPRHTPLRTIDKDWDKEIEKSRLLALYHAFDESLEKIPHFEETGITHHICQISSNLSNTLSSQTSEKLIEEAGYIASRIMETASFVRRLGRKAKLLAVVDVKHYVNIQYAISLLTKGITDEVYLSPRNELPAMAMVCTHSAKLTEYAQEHSPKTTLVQELFGKALEKLSEAKENEELPESEVDELISTIASRTRNHPEISRGASVRGTIAFKEVLQSFREMQGRLTRSSIEKAALITLPSRISTKQGDYESALAIVRDIVTEVLYGIRFSRTETISPDKMDWLSPEDIMAGLQNLKPTQLSPEQKRELAQKGQMVIIPNADNLADALRSLNPKDFPPNQYSALKKVIDRLLENLAQKLGRGEITEEEYNREKARLEEMLRTASQPQYPMTNKELTETVMELMDAQDKQWQNEISFEQMYIYYHIKAMSEGKELSPPKRDYYGLKVLIDDLEKRGILRAMTPGRVFTLTAQALDILLEHLILKPRKGKELKSLIRSGKTPLSERKHEIRRYTLGDVFRDISVRHTLREIVKQKKKLSEIARRDFKVFMKQRRRVQSDIVLCIDTSSSMGYRHKLTYARLAAAGLARAALENEDRVGIVTFDNFGRTVMPLTTKKEEIVNYIVSLSAGGNTNIGEGIRCATELLLREPSHNQKYTVLITDGQPTAISEKAFEKLKPMKERDLTAEYAIVETRRAATSGTRVSVIHIADGGRGVDEGFVKNVAKVGKGKVQRISCLDDLRAIMR